MRDLNDDASLEDTLAHALDHHDPERVVLLCSFQKEESVLIDALIGLDRVRLPRIATIDTGVLLPATLATWRSFEDHFGISIEVFDAADAEGVGWTAERCCGERKVAALEAAVAGADAWITGIRREQAPTRANAQKLERDEGRGLWKYNPLADWTEKDLWRRIFDRGAPYNVLHDHGYSSIGCAPCTAPGDGREGRWSGSAKTECGLHV